MAEIIVEPTALSKVIPLKFKINDVDVPKTTQLSTNKQFNTTDTDAWFTFELDGLASINGTYDLTLINLDDKSIFHHADVIFPALPFHYKLNSSEDVTLNEIRHAGRWLGQLVVTMANGDTTARQFGFNIAGHILDGQDAQVILLSDYQALINTINLAKDDLAQYNVDYAALIADVTTAEGLREQAEIDRAATFDALVESEMVAQNVATKLAEKEATFAPRMLSLESELAQVNTDYQTAAANLTIDSEVILARNSAAKNKTSASLDARIEEVETDTYFPATNLVTNGDFSNAGTGWDIVNATGVVFDGGSAKFTATALNGGIKAQMNIVNGHSYYIAADVTADSYRVYIDIAGVSHKYHSAVSGKERLSKIINWTSSTLAWPFQIMDARTSGWTEVTVDNVVCVDLTVFASVIPVPSITQMDTLLSRFTNSYFDGTKNILLPKQSIKESIEQADDHPIVQKVKDVITVDVKSYGAVGDGVTDDTTAIAKAITALPTNGVLFFPPGTYLVTNIALKSNMVVKGIGYGSTIKLKGGILSGPANCLNVIGISNVFIRDLQLDGNRVNNQTTGPSADSNFNGIHILNSSEITVENVWSHSNGYQGCIMVNDDRITIRNCKFTNNGYRPFHGHATVTNSQFTDNYCAFNGQGFTGEAVDAGPYDGIFFFDNVHDVLIADNRIVSNSTIGCIVIGGTLVTENPSYNIVVADNVCSSNKGTASGIVLIGTQLKNVVINSNSIHDCLHGINGGADFPTIGDCIVISNNVITDNAGTGIRIMAEINNSNIIGNTIRRNVQNGLLLTKLNDSVVFGNNLLDNGPSEGIVLVTALRNIITGNVIKNSVSGYQTYGIRELRGCDSNFIHGNQIHQMDTAATYKVGVNSVIKDNFVNGVYTA